jgi:hypothetical protein
MVLTMVMDSRIFLLAVASNNDREKVKVMKAKIEDARKKKPSIDRTQDKDELKEYGCMEEEQEYHSQMEAFHHPSIPTF